MLFNCLIRHICFGRKVILDLSYRFKMNRTYVKLESVHSQRMRQLAFFKNPFETPASIYKIDAVKVPYIDIA